MDEGQHAERRGGRRRRVRVTERGDLDEARAGGLGERWVWGVVALLVAAVVGLAAYNAPLLRRGATQVTDPALRLQTALQILGARGMPPGLSPGDAFLMSIRPFYWGEELLLTDQPPAPDGSARVPASRGLVYAHFPDQGAAQRQLMRNLSRSQQGVRLELWTWQLRIEGREIIRIGETAVKDMKVEYVAQRGIVVLPTAPVEGIVTVLALGCPDQRTRTAVWFGPDPDPTRPVAEASFATTPADEEAIRLLLGYFDVCAARISR